MKEVLLQYASYHIWANEKIIATVKQLPPDQIDQTVESSFSTLHLNFIHLWESEYFWYQRLLLAENIVSPATDKTLSIDFICNEWLQQSTQIEQFIIKSKEANLTHVFAYMTTKKQQFKQPVYQVLLHIFNHATYHRGQIVTMLRQLGVKKIPATDFIVWSRSVSKMPF
ncbi:MAG: hypothetical protein JWR18_2665 [Segetibacter sp.]|nr:hypothetical protein [Segetibacter sp.]